MFRDHPKGHQQVALVLVPCLLLDELVLASPARTECSGPS